jgi:hypothetical protein
MKIKDLKVNPNNPQKFDDLSKLQNSIKEFPKMMELRPMVYDPKTKYVLGGNKRLICLQNLEFKEIPDNWVISADKLTEEEKKRFVIADNVGFGEWDEEKLIEWDEQELADWGLELDNIDADPDDYGDNFELNSGEKNPFQQITFTLSDEQAEEIKEELSSIQKTPEYKETEFFNDNSNGNALYLIIKQWKEMNS